MTILWIYNMPLVPEAGGTERITSLISNGLSANGYVCLGMLVADETTGSFSYDGQPVSDLYRFLKEKRVDVVINQITYARWLLELFLSKGGNRWHQEGGKIISCLHFDPKPASTFHYFKSIREKSFVEYVNLAKTALLYGYYEHRNERAIGETYNWLYDNSDAYVTLSERHFSYLKKVTRREDYTKLYAINNPLTFDDIMAEKEVDRKKDVVLVCARMDEYQKRISYVLKAWKRIQDTDAANGWQLKLVGTGPDLERYKSYAHKQHLKRVSFEGRQNPEPYYKEANIFLMTSYRIEGWGLTLTECLQRGVVPVVMNSCPVFSDIIVHCYNGYLCKDRNLSEFSAYILSLMTDRYGLRAKQINALRSASSFSRDVVVDKWIHLLDNI